MKTNQITPHFYVNIFDSMMTEFKIRLEPAWILVKLFNLSKNGLEDAYIGTDIIGDILQISQRTVQRHVTLLVREELITVKRTKWNRTKMKPTKKFSNWIWGQRCENETVKQINDSARDRKEAAA